MNTDDTVDGRSGAGFIAADAAADDMTGPAIERAWHAFTHEGTDPHLSPAVRPEIADSWVRSRAFGLDPHNRVLSSPVTTEEFDKILDIYEPLIEITRPMIGIVDDLGIDVYKRQTYNILKHVESFNDRVNIHIVQCDARVQEDTKITSLDQLDEYLRCV